MTKVDPALITLLSLSPSSTTLSSAGGGGCSSASTSKLTSTLPDGSTKHFFLKTGVGKEAEVMFAGEHASLSAIHSAVPSLCPKSFGHGRFVEAQGMSFLVTEFLDLGGGGRGRRGLAKKLAELHTTPAPTPDGYENPQFGFPATTCCGDTPQDNTFTSSWADFYANHRLRFILAEAKKAQRVDKELEDLVEKTCDEVTPRLIGDAHLNHGRGITAVVVHGDLWSGNAATGSLPSMSSPEAVVYDPSACYAHSEFELGIMKMFGGFGSSFLEEYHALVPKTEPVGEYEDRVKLYELYHHLNHFAMFGGGYRGGAVAIMRELVGRFGGNGRAEL